MEWIRGETSEMKGQPGGADLASWVNEKTETTTSILPLRQDASTVESPRPAERTRRPLPNGLIRPSPLPLPDKNTLLNIASRDSGQLDAAESRVLSKSDSLMGRRLFPSEPVTSIRERRESQGQPIPTLHLSREAITPRLWLDDELNAMFTRETHSEGPYGGIEPVSVGIQPRSESRLGRKWVDEEEEMLVSVYHS